MSDTDTIAVPATENSTDEPEQQSDAAEEPKLPHWKALLRAYQQLFVDIARQDIYAARDIVAKSPKFAVKRKGTNFHE